MFNNTGTNVRNNSFALKTSLAFLESLALLTAAVTVIALSTYTYSVHIRCALWGFQGLKNKLVMFGECDVPEQE